jgi:hypothetical protein
MPWGPGRFLRTWLVRVLALAATSGWLPLSANDVDPAIGMTDGSAWVVHLQLDRLLETEVGRLLARELLDPKLRPEMERLKEQHGVDLDWWKTRSVTAFGPDLTQDSMEKTMILAMAGPHSFEKNLDILLAQERKGKPDSAPYPRKEDREGRPVYRNTDLTWALPHPELLLTSRSTEGIDKALETALRTNGSPINVTVSPDLPITSNAVAFIRISRQLDPRFALPPEAKVLRHVTRTLLSAGITDESVVILAGMEAQDEDAAGQIRDIFQGLLALASLQSANDSDLGMWARATRITVHGGIVIIETRMPAGEVLRQLSDHFAR